MEIHRRHPCQVPPQMSLWHHLHQAGKGTKHKDKTLYVNKITNNMTYHVSEVCVCLRAHACECSCVTETYAFHLQGGEQRAGHGHAQRDGEDENERKCQGEGAHLHHPQDSQAHQLNGSEEMHPHG